MDGALGCAGAAAGDEVELEDWGNAGATRSKPANEMAAKRLAIETLRSMLRRIAR
jgi:hypothetical protein